MFSHGPMFVLLSLVGLLALAAGYFSYIRDSLRGDIQPHPFTWGLWGGLTLMVGFMGMASSGGGGSALIAISSLPCFAISLLGAKNGWQVVRKSDWVYFALSLVAGILWLAGGQVEYSLLLLIIADLMAFAPTFVKSWHLPHSEKTPVYLAANLRYGIALITLASFSFATVAYPICVIASNSLLVCLLLVRRRQLAANDESGKGQ